MVPRGGERVDDSLDVYLRLVKPNDGTNPSVGNCGENRWQIKWELSEKGAAKIREKGGYILQRIRLHVEINDCSGPVENIVGKLAEREGYLDSEGRPTRAIDFWEAWPIKPGETTSEVAGSFDVYADPDFGDTTCGMIVLAGDYYLVPGAMPAALVKEKVKMAGELPSTYDDMSMHVKAISGGTHDLSIKWDCCNDDCVCPELKVS